MEPTGRNDPCPCGSGLKYKKCCLLKTELRSPEASEAEQIRAQALKKMSEGKWVEAVKDFSSILETVPDRCSVLEAIAACYDGMEDYLRAAEYIEKSLSSCPEERVFYLSYSLGVARACAGRMDKAAEAFEKALYEARAEKESYQVTEAIEMIARVGRGEENSSIFLILVQLQRAFSDMEADDFQGAARRLEKIRPLDPDNPVILYNLGVVNTFLKREDEALALLERVVTLDPLYASAWYNMGQICLVHKRDYSRALHCFDRAVAARPDYVGAHNQMGVVWEILGDTAKALNCWRKALELDPQNKQIRENIERLGGRQAPAPQPGRGRKENK